MSLYWHPPIYYIQHWSRLDGEAAAAAACIQSNWGPISTSFIMDERSGNAASGTSAAAASIAFSLSLSLSLPATIKNG
jgi:hypothetical protein